MLRRLRPLTEWECYARCYGTRVSTVQVLRAEGRGRAEVVRLSGEGLRRLFEKRLEARGGREASEARAA